MREALISQSVNHGFGGNKRILAKARARLSGEYGTVVAAPAQAQLDAIYESRKNYVNRLAENKNVRRTKAQGAGKRARCCEA